MVRRLGASAAAVALKLKDLAPYAVIALVVPGGALMALLLWSYRRQKRRRVFPDSLDTLFERASISKERSTYLRRAAAEWFRLDREG